MRLPNPTGNPIAGILFLILISFFTEAQPFVQILGIAQDGGYPHIGCEKSCCAPARHDPALREPVVSLALADPTSKQWWLFEATPDINEQLHAFHAVHPEYPYLPAGIFITHAHIGHYTGLMQLGREALGSKGVLVYVMERMATFLSQHGPWSQLVALNNISLQVIKSGSISLTKDIDVRAFTVPHRDEFSETVGFRITTSAKKYLFIPDIDKWEKWSMKIEDQVNEVDYALLDATFNTASELPNRSMSEIPHPLVAETISRFELVPQLKERIYLIHLNHTNPLLWNQAEQAALKAKGFNVAETGMILR